MLLGPGPARGLAGTDDSEAQVYTEALPPYRIVHVNRAWEQVCGFCRAEVVGKTCRILQGAETCRTTLDMVHQNLRNRQGCAVRLVNYTKDGNTFLNDLTIEPISDLTGVKYFLGTLRLWAPCCAAMTSFPRLLISPEEHAEIAQMVRQIPSTLAEALQNTDRVQVITEKDPPFVIVHVNAAWCRACGYTADEAQGNTCRILQGTQTCRNTLEALGKAAAEANSVTVRLLNYTQDGTPFMNTLLVAPLQSGSGRYTHMLGVMLIRSIDPALHRFLPRELTREAAAAPELASRQALLGPPNRFFVAPPPPLPSASAAAHPACGSADDRGGHSTPAVKLEAETLQQPPPQPQPQPDRKSVV